MRTAPQPITASVGPQAVPNPAPPAATPAALTEPPASVETAAEVPTWYVRPPAGGQYGPADDAMMRQWMGEGRVPSDALVWRTGWTDWQQADTIGHQLPGGTANAKNTKIEVPNSLLNDSTIDPKIGTRRGEGGPMPAESAASRLQRKRKAAARTQAWMAGLLLVIAIILGVVLFVVLSGSGSTPAETPANTESEEPR